MKNKLFVIFAFAALLIIGGCAGHKDADPAEAVAGPTTASLKVTMNLPESCTGKQYIVVVMNSLGFDSSPILEIDGTCPANTTIEETFTVGPGNYFIVAMVKNTLSGEFTDDVPIPGDMLGVYGIDNVNEITSLPETPNAGVSGYGTECFEINLVEIDANVQGDLYYDQVITDKEGFVCATTNPMNALSTAIGGAYVSGSSANKLHYEMFVLPTEQPFYLIANTESNDGEIEYMDIGIYGVDIETFFMTPSGEPNEAAMEDLLNNMEPNVSIPGTYNIDMFTIEASPE